MCNRTQTSNAARLIFALASIPFTLTSNTTYAATRCPLIASAIEGPIFWSTGNCTVTEQGSISANSGPALSITSTSVGVLSNNGAITGATGIANPAAGQTAGIFNNASGTITASSIAVSNLGAIGTLSNSGQITITNDSSASVGISNFGTIGTLTNNGTISTGEGINHVGIDSPGTIGTLTNTGTINGGGTGVAIEGTLGTFVTSGTISGSGDGISNTGKIGTVMNTGVIHGNAAFDNAGGTTGTLSNSGSLEGDIGIGNGPSGTIGELINRGNIKNRLESIANQGTIGTLFNENSIDGSDAAIANAQGATIGTIRNTGTIVGSTAFDNTGTIDTIINRGVIRAASFSIDNTGSIKALMNAGTISADGLAIDNESTGTIGTITNSGTISGTIYNNSGNDLTINGGSGHVVGVLSGTNGTIGAISNTSSNVIFGSGNLVLNDTVNVGSNAVHNRSSNLQVNTPIAITGDYTQGTGASLIVGVSDGAVTNGSSSDSGYGRLVVSGSVNIAPGSSIALQKLNTYAFAPGQRFVVLDASANGTHYNEDSLNYSASGFGGTVSGTAVTVDGRSDLVVDLTGSNAISSTDSTTLPIAAPTPTIATLPNATASLTGLASYTGTDPELLNVFDASMALNQDTSATANRAGNQLSPVSQTAVSRAALMPAFDVLDVVASHVNSLRLQTDADQSGSDSGPSGSGLWGQAIGGHAHGDAHDQIDGYSTTYGGVLVGADKRISDNWRAGGVFSYTNSKVDDLGDSAGDSARISTYGLTGHLTSAARPWYLNLFAEFVQQHYATTRTIDFPGFSSMTSGRFSGQQYLVRVETGYPWASGNLTLTPIADITYGYLHQNGHTETGGDGAALAIDAAHVTSVKSDVGVKLERQFHTTLGNVAPYLQVQWRHEYVSNRMSVTANYAADSSGDTTFTTLGTKPISDIADITVGATLVNAKEFTLTARYDLQLAPHFIAQTGGLRLSKQF